MLSFDELVRGCLKNSRMHQKALYDQFSTSMYSLLFRMLNDREMAHDVLQDAFIAVFQSLTELQKTESLPGWIKTIVVRTAIHKLRERSKFIFENTDEIKEVVFPDDNFTAIQLDEAIRSLPKGNRLVFMLVEVEGYKHREVAEMLQISEGTSKSQLKYCNLTVQDISGKINGDLSKSDATVSHCSAGIQLNMSYGNFQAKLMKDCESVRIAANRTTVEVQTASTDYNLDLKTISSTVQVFDKNVNQQYRLDVKSLKLIHITTSYCPVIIILQTSLYYHRGLGG